MYQSWQCFVWFNVFSTFGVSYFCLSWCVVFHLSFHNHPFPHGRVLHITCNDKQRYSFIYTAGRRSISCFHQLKCLRSNSGTPKTVSMSQISRESVNVAWFLQRPSSAIPWDFTSLRPLLYHVLSVSCIFSPPFWQWILHSTLLCVPYQCNSPILIAWCINVNSNWTRQFVHPHLTNSVQLCCVIVCVSTCSVVWRTFPHPVLLRHVCFILFRSYVLPFLFMSSCHRGLCASCDIKIQEITFSVFLKSLSL